MRIDHARRFEIKLVAGLLLVHLVFLVLAIATVLGSRQQYRDNLQRTAHNLTLLLERGIADKARLIDDALVRIERELDRQMQGGGMNRARIERLVASEEGQLPEINAIRITNAQGEVVLGRGVVPGVNASYADRDFFVAHRERMDRSLIISPPLLGKVSGIWAIAFTRSYRTGEGGFAGVVSAAVPVETFAKLLALPNLGPDDTVVLRYADSGLIARIPKLEGPAGQPGHKQVAPEFAEAEASGATTAIVHTAATPDAVERSYAVRRVAGLPFTVAVGLVEEAYLTPWKWQALLGCLLLGILIVGTSLLGWRAIRHLRETAAREQAQIDDMTRRRILIDQSSDGIVVLDHEGKVWEANRRFAEMLGYTPEEVQRLHVWDWDRQWTREELLVQIDQSDASGARFETRHVRKDGTVFDVEISSNGAHCSGGKLIFCVCRDISERKQSAAALKASEERYQRLFSLLRLMADTMPDMLWAKDLHRRYIFANKALCRQLLNARDTSEPIGKTDTFFGDRERAAHPDKPDWYTFDIPCTDSDALTLKEMREMHFEESGLVRGRQLFLDVYKAPLFNAQGQLIGVVGSGRDVTERKQVEEERKNLQAQLLHAQKMEAIGTLAGGIAHDFNNILGAVLGYAELAREATPDGTEAADDLDRVLEAGNRAAALVKQILAFSRQTATERIPLAPIHMVKEAIRLLRPTLPATIMIRHRLESGTKSILADPSQLHQVVMNLCTNAYHAMERTGGVLDIDLEERELTAADLQSTPNVQPGPFVVLSVGDTGPGIPPEIRSKIFNPFFTTKEVGKGTGMGLAIVHGIATASGGFVTCESEPGNGAVFRVFFPALEEKVSREAPAAVAAPTGRERILFVDDDDILTEMGQTMLERLGYEVTVFTSSVAALAEFERQPDRFDAVITDQTMPEITGVDLARKMLRIRPDLPIILCTGFSNLVTEEQVKAYGIKGFAMKPLTKKEIAVLLRSVLEDGQGEEAALVEG